MRVTWQLVDKYIYVTLSLLINCKIEQKKKKGNLCTQCKNYLSQIRKRRHIGLKSHESPSPENVKEAKVGLGS